MVDKLKVVEIDISKITMYENNAKLHPDSQIEQIANSIKRIKKRKSLYKNWQN